MTDTKYNGWTNYETWCVKLWIDNDQGSHEYWLEMAREHLKDVQENPHPYALSARGNLASTLKDYHQEAYMDALPEHLQTSMFSDMLGAAFAAVDWDEIAERMLDDVAEGVS